MSRIEQSSMDFGPDGRKRDHFEVHEHVFVRGPRSGGHYERNGKWSDGHFSHSHESGHIPHTHADTGPGSYTIDKDEWLRATGLRGGGRKKFTKKPSGEQMPFVERTPEENRFEVIVGPPPNEYKGEGPGVAPAVRMILGFGMTPVVKGDDMKPSHRSLKRK